VSETWSGEPAADVEELVEEEEELPRLRTTAEEEEQQHAYGELDIPDDVNVL
jgi:hypothetical protein